MLVDSSIGHILTLCEDYGSFVETFVRLAVSAATDSSAAVLQAMMAVASTYRYGVKAEAFRFQGKAIQALQSSLSKSMGYMERIQHIAANLLLSVLEVSNNQL